jgi:hypothetical protein
VKQNNLGEYEANARDKQNIQDRGKAPTLPQTKTKHKLPLKPSHMDGKHQFSNSRGQQSKLKVFQ